MDRYILGDRIRLPEAGGEGIPVNRVEVLRPDGTTAGKDWDKRSWEARLMVPGTWRWSVYVRREGETSCYSGEFEVIEGERSEQHSPLIRRLIDRGRRI